MKKISLFLAFIAVCAFSFTASAAVTDTLTARFHPEKDSVFKIVIETKSGQAVAPGYKDTTSVDTFTIVALLTSDDKPLPATNLSPKTYLGVGKKGLTPTGKQVPQNDFTTAVFHSAKNRVLTYQKNGFIVYYGDYSDDYALVIGAMKDYLGISTYFTKGGQLNH